MAFKDDLYAALARSLRSLGFTSNHDFMHTPRGWNSRMSTTHAKLILENLQQADANIAERHRVIEMYDARCPVDMLMPPRLAPWVYDIVIDGMDADKQNDLIKALHAAGVPARHCFARMSIQDEFRNCRSYCRKRGDDGLTISKARRLSNEVIYLPVRPGVETKLGIDMAFSVIERTVLA